MIKRRNFLIGLIAAPVIVRASSLMKVRGIVMPVREKLIGTTIYVAVDGDDDGNDGWSPASAFKTIQRAYEKIAAADMGGDPITIQLAAGDYPAPLIGVQGVILTGTGPSTRVHGMLKVG